MSNNNNFLTEISALVLAVLLMIGGVLLLYTGKIDYANSVFFFLSALGLFGFNSAWKAPSPAQQQLLAQMVSQQAPQASEPVQAPVAPQAQQAAQSVPLAPIPFSNTVTSTAPQIVQAPQFVQPAPQPFGYEPSTTYPNLPVAPQQ